jgi:NAD(P)-dependent dehydrogenase (short-subunit alcohol dehydrogenase family)
MSTILITGANGGIGFELSKQYLQKGWRVIATCRNLDNAKELMLLKGDLVIETLEMQSLGQINQLAQKYASDSIDILFINAGINHQMGALALDTEVDRWQEYFSTNTIGPFQVATQFAPMVANSNKKIIVAMGSMAGSMSNEMKGSYLYRSSKAALHVVMKNLAKELHDKGIITLVMHPGRVKGPRTPNNPLPVYDSVKGMINLIDHADEKMNGCFLNYLGEPMPW